MAPPLERDRRDLSTHGLRIDDQNLKPVACRTSLRATAIRATRDAARPGLAVVRRRDCVSEREVDGEVKGAQRRGPAG